MWSSKGYLSRAASHSLSFQACFSLRFLMFFFRQFPLLLALQGTVLISILTLGLLMFVNVWDVLLG